MKTVIRSAMKKAAFLFFTISSFSFSLVAQQPGTDIPKGNAKISGQVLDGDTNQPVEFANIVLIDPGTSKAIDGTVCDMEGKFTLTKLAEGTYTLTISFIGYETKTIENITVDKRGEVALPTIKLSTDAKVLNEVLVEGKRPLIEERVDRTVYNAENDETTKGGDAADVLRRVPLLSVDLDGNVSMRGNENIMVLINNKPSTITAGSVADALKQIPADMIKSVEVITSPSAKYDAEGSAGIINIITKKNTLQGVSLNVNAGAGLRGSNLGLNGSIRRGKMGFTLGGFGRASYNVKGSFENTQQTGDRITKQFADTRSNNLFGRYSLGWDYDINDKNYLAASVRYGVRNGNSYQDNLTTEYYDLDNNQTNPSVNRDNKTIDKSGTIDLSLDYTHYYETKGHELTFSGQYSRNNRNNDFTNTVFTSSGDIDSLVRNDNFNYNEEFTGQVDYQLPIKSNQMLEIGVKNIGRIVSSDYATFVTYADGVEQERTNPQNNNTLEYNQNITAGYASYTYSTQNGYSFKGGARYEYTMINAAYQNNSESPDPEIPSYGVLVPSLNASKKLSNGNTIKISYNRRIQRPSIRYLNPNIQAANPLNITIGNPNLDPEYTNNYEVGYSMYIKSSMISLSAFARNTRGAIQSIRDTTAVPGIEHVPGQIITRFDNIGKEDAYGVSIFSNVTIGSKFSINGSVDTYYAVLDNNNPDPLLHASNEGWVISGRLSGDYNFGSGWAAQFFTYYRGNRVQLQGSQGGFGMYSLGFRKEFNDKRASIGFAAENFLTASMKMRSELETPTVSQKSLNTMRNMSFRINFSFRIGKMSFDEQPRRRRGKSISNDDMKDGSGGSDMGDIGQTQGGGNQRGGNNPQFTMPQKPAATDTTKNTSDSTGTVPDSLSADASGTWNYTVESPQGANTGNFTLTRENGLYKGTITSARMPEPAQLTSATVKGNELTLDYTMNFNGNSVPVTIKGIITDNTFEGTLSFGTFRTMPVKATRQ
jgi:outer membrane receptor protein involved in Fe transport